MSRKQIAVIDYGMGNLHSVSSALKHVASDVEVSITDNAEIIMNADHVVFPGVGAMRDCMAEIFRLNVDKTLRSVIDSGKPVLAICVGMQALLNQSSENGGVSCLGHFPGEVSLFSDVDNYPSDLKVPHMGWNQVQQSQSHPLWQGIENNARFYFVHSYFVNIEDKSLEAGATNYGVGFTAAIAKDNVFAAQFHPEKSHSNGLQLLKNFVNWDGVQA